jgi:hypothetical protein
VILLRKPGVLFVKGGKVAGTSIEVFLATHAGPNDIVTPISPPNPLHASRNYLGPNGQERFYNHMSASEIRGLVGADYFNGLRRFGVVRDPFEKIRSIFAMHHVLNDGDYDVDRAIDDAWSEADKYCDGNGGLMLTDVIRYEALEPELKRFFDSVGIPFEKLDIREKDDYRKRCPVEPRFTEAHNERIRRKFAWEIANYYPQHAATGGEGARNMNTRKDTLTEWHANPENLSLQNLDSWYLGATVHTVPRKEEFGKRGIESILEGWLPAQPLIREDTRVIGVGSCFARYFILWLAENGFNKSVDTSPYNALMRYGATFESPAVIAQQFRWAFDEFSPGDVVWIGKDKEVFEANEERRQLVRDTLQKTDLLLLTLGLSEIWFDRKTGEPLWRALTRRHYDPERHVFRVETMQDTKRHLEKIEALRAKHLPNLKIVYTLSPVRMTATFRPVSAITANSVSKAILRSALDEFLREHADVLNRDVFYFPSYEIVHDYFRDPFEEDNRHVTNFVASHVVQTFARHYCAPEMLEQMRAKSSTGSTKLDNFLAFAEGAPRDVRGDEFRARITDLEAQVESLQRTADERMKVITELDQAARERLALIERLHAECAALREQGHRKIK